MKIKNNNSMKKIIPSIILTASASCNLLLAQAENRLEEAERAFPCSITANCQLPSANCDNLGQDLSCHLMMNPATPEEGAEALGEGLGVFGKRVTTTTIANTGPQTTGVGIALVQGERAMPGSQSAFSIDCNSKAEGAKERARGDKEKAETAQNEKRKCWFEKSKAPKRREASAWNDADSCSMQASDFWNKASEAHTQGNESLADLCLRTANQYEKSAEYNRKVATIAINQDITDFYRFLATSAYAWSSAIELEKAVIALEKATQAIAENQGELVALLMQASKQHEESAEYFTQAANAKIGGNIIDFDRFDKASGYSQNSADELEKASIALKKATQASAINQGELAALLMQASKQHEESAEYFSQAANAKISGNTTDFDRFDRESTAARQSAQQLEDAANALKR